jgi:hypothetical protein
LKLVAFDKDFSVYQAQCSCGGVAKPPYPRHSVSYHTKYIIKTCIT